MSRHVDVVINDYQHLVQVLGGRIYAHGSQTYDGRATYVMKHLLDAAQEPDRLDTVQWWRRESDYSVVTDAHEDTDCPFAETNSVPMEIIGAAGASDVSTTDRGRE